MRLCLIVLAFVAGFAFLIYITPPPDPNSVSERLRRGEAVLSSVAPDGTKLWHVERGGRDIYYSTGGTQTTRTEGSGKQAHTVDVIVPNGG